MKGASSITPVVSFGGISLLRSVSLLPAPVFVVERDRQNLVFSSSQYAQSFVIKDWHSNHAATVSALIDIAKKCSGKPILFYGNDSNMMLVSRYRGELQKHFKYLLPDTDVVEACVNKELFADLATKYNLPVPCSYKISELLLSVRKNQPLSFPYILKPFLVSGRPVMKKLLDGSPQKMLLVESSIELLDICERLGNEVDSFLAQEFITGGEENIYSFHAYVDEHSQPLGWYVGKKIRTYPSVGGYSSFVTLVKDKRVAELGFDIVKRLKLRGPVKIDIKKDAKRGEYFLLEINLRYNLWNYLGACCGINLAEVAYKNCNSQTYIGPESYRTDVRWLSFRYDSSAFLKCYWPQRKLTVVSWMSSLLGRNIYHVFSWRDPLPFVVSVMRQSRRLAMFVMRFGRASK